MPAVRIQSHLQVCLPHFNGTYFPVCRERTDPFLDFPSFLTSSSNCSTDSFVVSVLVEIPFFKKSIHSLTEKYLSKWVSSVFTTNFSLCPTFRINKNMGVPIIAWTNKDSL